MSRVTTLTLVGLALCAGWAHDARSQESPEELRAQLDSLAPLVLEARVAAERRQAVDNEIARRTAAAVTLVDTLRVGPMIILTPEGQGEATREVFENVWQERFAHLGYSSSLDDAVFVYQRGDRALPIHVEGTEPHRLHLGPWVLPSVVENSVADVIGGTMSHDLQGTGIGAWSRGSPLLQRDPERLYRQVATTHSKATRSCMGGDVEACASAMEITGAQDMNRLREWYTPEERRSIVAGYGYPFTRYRAGRDAVARRQTCIEDHALDLCDELLAENVSLRSWAPFGPDVRRTVVRYAIDRGGEGAWERLIEEPEMTAVEALEHASNLPLDELMAGWQAELVTGRPEAHEHLVPRSGLTLLWTLVFAAFAMRSTRWRFG